MVDSSSLAAEDAWSAVQTFYRSLPEINPGIKSKTFHLATQSYGGHWGPVFFNHFRKQNQPEASDLASNQVTLEIGTLLVINGLIDYKFQVSAYPEFARKNTHGLAFNETLVNYMETALHMEKYGCLAQLQSCANAEKRQSDMTLYDDMQCNTATALCRNTVELVYLLNSPDPYDVRNHTLHPQPPNAFSAYLNTGEVQQS
jgi:carboxypeptidase C (cathepsin A)